MRLHLSPRSSAAAAAGAWIRTVMSGDDGQVRRGTRYEPETARRAVRDLAAVTDEQLSAEIRAAATAALARVEDVTASGRWPAHPHERVTHAALRRAAQGLANLPADAPATDVRAAAAPILGVYWPNSPDIMRPAHDAIEELRGVAMHRWSLVRDARLITRADNP